MKKAVGYCRYSSTNQREESIEAQMRAIKQYCLNKNIELISFYKDEAISGTSIKDRENFLEMISESKNKKFDFVIVHKFDRFARNRYDHAVYERKLNENNVMLLSVLEEMADTPESVILKSVLTGMNEYYSLNLSREVKKGKKETALKGMHNGGLPPLGYDLSEDKKYIVNKDEAEAVKRIFDLALQNYSYSKIADTLNKEGYKNKSGNEFKKTSVRDTLLNMKYIGNYFLGLKDRKGNLLKEPLIIENSHEPIIEKSIFYKVQERFKKHGTFPRQNSERVYFLTGHCKCGLCGGNYTGGYRSKSKNGEIIYAYYCKNTRREKNRCKNRYIRKEELEQAIVNTIKTEILSDINIKVIAKDIVNLLKKDNKEVVTKIEKYKKEIEKLNKKALKLLDRSLGDFIPEEAFKIKSKEIKEEIDTIKSKLYFIEENKDKVLTEDETLKILNSFKEKNDKEIDTEIVETFVKDIKIFKDKIELILFKVPKIVYYGDPDVT